MAQKRVHQILKNWNTKKGGEKLANYELQSSNKELPILNENRKRKRIDEGQQRYKGKKKRKKKNKNKRI